MLRSWRRKRVLKRATIDEALWRRVVAKLPFLAGLSADESRRLRELVVLFLHEKEMAGAGGLALTDEIRLAVALQACLPILNLGLDFYAGWVGIVVYPSEFRVRRQELDEDGVMHEWDDELSGEAWPGGPVALSWEDVEIGTAAAEDGGEPGYNVVIHEFAHKIDMLKGEADGFPLAHDDMDAGVWQRTLESAYARFVGMVDREKETLLDPYGAEHPAEFFAVTSEAFFTDPHALREEFPGVYEQLKLFYRQDPAARLAPSGA
ncbi:MAG: zinc-dependent peptidase [Bacteroidota bacterium]|nr:M90 family metallopeptidase [Burkholderiales bacterium]